MSVDLKVPNIVEPNAASSEPVIPAYINTHAARSTWVASTDDRQLMLELVNRIAPCSSDHFNNPSYSATFGPRLHYYKVFNLKGLQQCS